MDALTAMKQAREALRRTVTCGHNQYECANVRAIAALDAAIEQAEKAEPEGWLRDVCRYISETLESGTSNERIVARTIMHLLPIEYLFSMDRRAATARTAPATADLSASGPPITEDDLRAMLPESTVEKRYFSEVGNLLAYPVWTEQQMLDYGRAVAARCGGKK